MLLSDFVGVSRTFVVVGRGVGVWYTDYVSGDPLLDSFGGIVHYLRVTYLPIGLYIVMSSSI